MYLPELGREPFSEEFAFSAFPRRLKPKHPPILKHKYLRHRRTFKYQVT